MKKSFYSYCVIGALSFGLVGCGANNESAQQDRNRNGMQPVGYYSNENHERNRSGGNATLLDGTDNDGPVTELMDHSFGVENESTRPTRTLRRDRNTTRINGEQVRTEDGQLFSRDDYNYHGHLGNNVRKVESQYYYEAYEGRLVEKINNAVSNVQDVSDVQTVIHGNNAIIAVKLAKNSNVKATKAAIKRTVRPILNGKTSKIVTDTGTFNRLRNLDNNLRDWGPKDQIYLDIDNLFRSNNR